MDGDGNESQKATHRRMQEWATLHSSLLDWRVKGKSNDICNMKADKAEGFADKWGKKGSNKMYTASSGAFAGPRFFDAFIDAFQGVE